MGGTTGGEPAVAIKDCSFVYPNGRRILQNLSWRLSPGAFAVLTGPTGSGKTTLIRLLLRLALPESGEIYVLGEDLVRLPARRRPQLRRRIGVVAQALSLLDDRTVEQNLRLALEVRGKRGRAVTRRVTQLLQDGGLVHRRNELPIHLSGGERQRLAVARAAAGFPDLILADEPTAHLDPENAALVTHWLSRLQTAGSTVIVVTHTPRHFESVPAVRHYRLHRGAIDEIEP
jgi:cell division transport system ATP-binding protein